MSLEEWTWTTPVLHLFQTSCGFGSECISAWRCFHLIASLCTSRLEAGTFVSCLQGDWLIAWTQHITFIGAGALETSTLEIVKEWANTGANDPIAATWTDQLGYDPHGISMYFLYIFRDFEGCMSVLFLHFVNVHDVHCPCNILIYLDTSCISCIGPVFLVLCRPLSYPTLPNGIWKRRGCSGPEVTKARPGTPGTLCHPAWSLGQWSKWGAPTDFTKRVPERKELKRRSVSHWALMTLMIVTIFHYCCYYYCCYYYFHNNYYSWLLMMMMMMMMMMISSWMYRSCYRSFELGV